MDFLKNTHDLRLPKWGPYTKKYMGISHIADEKEGIRFDLSVIPGLFRKKVNIPNVLWDSDYHPWEASSCLDYYCHRHELEWKDRIYCDISFSKIKDNVRLIRCECVNNTDSIQNLDIHFMANINFPQINGSIKKCKVELPDDAVYIDSLDYTNLKYTKSHPNDNLISDGLLRGEVRCDDFVNGSGLGGYFGIDNGNQVVYLLNIAKSYDDCTFLIRYRLDNDKKVTIKFDGIINKTYEFSGTGEFQTTAFRIGEVLEGSHELKLTSFGGDEIQIDGFVLVSSELCNEVKFIKSQPDLCPVITDDLCQNSILLKYSDTKNYYGIKWSFDNYKIREFYNDELDNFMRYNIHNHVSTKLIGNKNGHYTNIFLSPICIKPHDKSVIYGIVCVGSKNDVIKSLNSTFDLKQYEDFYNEQKSDCIKFNCINQGEKYALSQRLMSTTVLTNVVYPVYIKRSFIRHSTPGRWWDSLYTWDSGFIGLGLADLDINRAIDNLNAYLTEPGDIHSAFIHHGSPVPVQHYLFLELWNKTQSKELLEYFYPRLRQYYLFLAGKTGSSTTNQLKSNILKTWDYFYNSGGWDDYPPQVYIHNNKLTKYIAPVANTSHAIRTAKILKMAALELGLKADVDEYNNDIEIFSLSLQKYSWDEESGYFGYVVHDENGNPTDILRHSSGANFNMGIDGVYPLVAGICNSSQQKKILSHLFTESELWTEIGLSTVDQSAPYYKKDGYWNGSVWFPHQWFIWKTLLDLGKSKEAFKVAKTGLDLWKNEADASYNCYEHFNIQSKRGAGWHHFSGLSSPVICWFNAYFVPGKITCGFDIWIKEKLYSDDFSNLKAELKLFGDRKYKSSIIITMNQKYKYKVIWNDNEIEFNKISDGILLIDLNNSDLEGILQIIKI